MNQRDGFGSGFLFGTIVGGVVGGFIGAILASRSANELPADSERRNAALKDVNKSKGKRRQIQQAPYSEQGIEVARRSLEDKIAQLNETIDEVRQTLGKVNGNQLEDNNEQASLREELR